MATTLKAKLADTLPALRDEMKEFGKVHGDKEVSKVTIGQILGGMRGIKSLISDTSLVPADQGLLVRGIPILNLVDRLPEEIFYLMLVGELPDADALNDLRAEFRQRGVVPRYVWNVLDAMQSDSHPMAMLTTALTTLERESLFRQKYREGMSKEEHWEWTYEDAMNILAKLPAIAAYIYRLRFDKGPRIRSNEDLDLGANYAYMLGIQGEHFSKLMQLYLVLHCDHEAGNVSAFTTHTVGSALSDAYYSLAAGLCGLAGPLHGLANQMCLMWIINLIQQFGGVPSAEQIETYARETLDSGKVIPGYGHAVLRVVDPRFTAFQHFGDKYCPNDPVFKTVQTVFDVVPKVLQSLHKVSNPWPNVDAISGALLYHFGLREFSYYTVLFAVSRAFGVLSNLILHRGISSPIVRPKSLTFDDLKKLAAQS